MSGGPALLCLGDFRYAGRNRRGPTECLETLGFESMSLNPSPNVNIGCTMAEIIGTKRPKMATTTPPPLPSMVPIVNGGSEEATEVVNRRIENHEAAAAGRALRRMKSKAEKESRAHSTFPPVLTTLKWNGRPGYKYVRRVEDDQRRLVVYMERSENREVTRLPMDNGRIAYVLVPSPAADDETEDEELVECAGDLDGYTAVMSEEIVAEELSSSSF